MIKGIVPFPEEYAAHYRKRGYWEDRSLADVFDEIFERFADRTAVVFGAERITYRGLAERSTHLALALLGLGLRPEDRVVVQLPNVPEFVHLYFALQKVGAVPVLALAPHRYHEIHNFAELTRAAAYVFPERLGEFDFDELSRRVKKNSRSLRLLLVSGKRAPEGAVSLSQLLQQDGALNAGELQRIRIDPAAPALFQISGGTTGIPKLIPRTHNEYVYQSKAAAALNDITPEDALLVALPMAHNFPLASPGIQGFFMRGGRVVLSTSTRASDVLPIIERERITHLELVPALLIHWLNDPSIKHYDLSSVRVINAGGQRLQPEIKRRAERLIPGCRVQEVFGMAEGLLCFVRLEDPDEVRMETVGRPICPDDEIKVVDDEGNEVPPGETGELLCRGPYTIRGYFDAPDYNARAFTPDGFYRTGDLTRLHPSGNLVVEGRKKDLINRGGEKISAEEVENLILSHPAVENAACVPMPDPVMGERMCAFVIVRPDSTITLPDLAAFLEDKGLARFKLPERLEVVEEFPRSPVGKVSKKALAALIHATSKRKGT
jgi:2,3-dihydroxybenzoate---[aryl-carrier protein] ligase